MENQFKLRMLQLIVTALVCLMPQSMYGAFMVDGLFFGLYDYSGEICVFVTSENSTGPRYTNLSGDLVIPSSITYQETSYNVRGISNSAFMMCNDITSVTIPSSVTSIGAMAFNSCKGLKTVVLPDSLAYVGANAFGECTSLETVMLPSKIKQNDGGMFYGCTGLTEITFPSTLKSIGTSMFSDCVNLTTVRLPEKLESIETAAFSGCSKLANIDFLSTLQSIGDYAFKDCSSLTSVKLPASLLGLGYDVFQDCSALQEIMSLALTPPTAHEDESGYEGQFYVVYPGTFNGIDKENCVLRVFESAMTDYGKAKGWRQFQNYEAINESEYIPGDVNGDGVVDIADVNGVINDMLGKAAIVVEVEDAKLGLALVEGGTFNMGTDVDEEQLSLGIYDNVPSPVHQVTLDSYLISTTEVTQKLFHAVMGGTEPEYEQMNCPIYGINLNRVNSFIQKLNEVTGLQFRLPTEAEWEYAARGGNKSQGYHFSGSNYSYEVGWCTYSPWGPTTDNDPRQVALLKPNELGIYDMSGNVWEWCQDWFGPYLNEAQTNPQGPETGTQRVIRGGSCYNDGDVTHCDVYNRAGVEPDKTVFGINNEPIGIRLAMDLNETLFNKASDINKDGVVDIADVNAVINQMLGKGYDVPTGHQGHDTAPDY
jgi:formylglycine-generating enzyme required for sulfatase activity